ncbi:hypothetical protein GRZ55_19375 [Chelativorans sp. ZYF759]|uniref:hypothetical protein n=1 Tax=Chelativorans sp. ZYF759 TaxID=2692213 RepID=UPI00145C95B6|nr:hypothetical protein [Chelativorans sp. ZYF759]NMG41410.1 hypothetical protein [Chelativorans sp. ZYF759]
MTQTRRIQLLAGGLLLVILGLAGSLMAIPLLIGEPLLVVRPGDPALLADAEDGEPATIQIQIGASGDFLMAVAREASVNLPVVRFHMLLHQMASVMAEVDAVADGIFRATGRLEMPGRWHVGIEFDDASIGVEFILAEF